MCVPQLCLDFNPFPYAELHPDGPGLLLYENALQTVLIKGCGAHPQLSLNHHSVHGEMRVAVSQLAQEEAKATQE